MKPPLNFIEIFFCKSAFSSWFWREVIASKFFKKYYWNTLSSLLFWSEETAPTFVEVFLKFSAFSSCFLNEEIVSKIFKIFLKHFSLGILEWVNRFQNFRKTSSLFWGKETSPEDCKSLFETLCFSFILLEWRNCSQSYQVFFETRCFILIV